MAASKLHLKNVNKDYKLEATDKRTNEGRVVYKNTKTGELHSELSMTLEMPEGSGNWINVPSLINGRVYNVQGVIDMLKAGKITPNSTGHATEDAAVEAAIFRSNNLQDDDGVTLKSNNEVDLKSNDPKIVRAYQPAYTSGSGANADIEAAAEAALAEDIATKQSAAQTKRLTEIMNNQDLEKDDSYFQRPIAGYINDPFTTTQYLNPRGLADREANMARGVENRAVAAEEAAIAEARKREEIIGQTMSAYGPRTGQSPIPKDAVMTYWDGRAYNGVVQMINGKPHDVAGQELIVNDAGTVPVDDTNKAMLAKADEERELRKSQKRNKEQIDRLAAIMDRTNAEKDDSYFYNPDNPDLNTPWKNWNAKYRMEDILRGTGLKGAENPTMNRYTQPPLSAQDQAMFDNAKEERRLVHMGKAMSSYEPRTTPEIDTGTRSRIELSDIRSDGPPRRQSNRPKSVYPDYKPSGRPENLPPAYAPPKNVKPDYGEMPGFKLPTDAKGKSTGNYWTVDSESSFWQTDAGYEKAMQVWGEKPGWVKPGYRPKRKEVDIEAIKKWFTPSK